jgi:phenylalanyl-tRNA synthetase beta chain
LQLAGGELLAGVVDVYPGKRAAKKIRVTRAEILRVMGADVPDKEVESALSALGFAPVRVDQNRGAEGSLLATWECTQPSWRAEVEREIDLIEEIARIYGMDKFTPRFPVARQGAARLPHYEAQARVRERLVGLGYQEILTIPHVDEARDALFRAADTQTARMANPLSEEAGVLRSTGLVTMAAALEWNLNHGQRNVRLFEIGRQYRLNGASPVETLVLTIGATGDAREKNLYDDARAYGFADLKGDIDALGELADGVQWRAHTASPHDWAHAARSGEVLLGGDAVGTAAQLARRVADRLKLRQDVFLAEIVLDPVYAAIEELKDSRRYEPLPRFPAVERDFSLLVSDGTGFDAVKKAIESLKIAEVVTIEAGDLYRGKNVPAGKYSLMVRVVFQNREATLTDAQTGDFSSRIVAALEKQVGAQLRVS